MGWLSLLGSFLGRNKQAPAPLQQTQVGMDVNPPQLQGAQPAEGGFQKMLGACSGPNPPAWCPQTGSASATATNASTGSEGLGGQA
jgi:hypothetical protein